MFAKKLPDGSGPGVIKKLEAAGVTAEAHSLVRPEGLKFLLGALSKNGSGDTDA